MSGLCPANPCMGKVLSGGAASFLTATSVCRGSNCPPPPPLGGAENGSDCHSQCLDPLLGGQTERFGGGRTVRPLWGRMVTICKCLWGKSLQCWIVWVGVSQCLNGGWPNHQGTKHHIQIFKLTCALGLLRKM
jgi:hypothetical protein